MCPEGFTIVMKNIIQLKKPSPAVLVVVVLSCLMIPIAAAEALRISPTTIETNLVPGKSAEGEMTVQNNSEHARILYSWVPAFEAAGEGGAQQFYLSEEGLPAWITVPPEITLQPGERKSVDYTIEVPEDAPPGGHYAAILWRTTSPDDEDGQVAVGASTGPIVLATVSGDIELRGGVDNFRLFREKNGEPVEQTVLTHKYLRFGYNFINQGDDRLRPRGEVVIRNIWGGESARIDANPRDGNVLPGQNRYFNDERISWGSVYLSDVGEQPVSLTERDPTFIESLSHQWNNFALGRYTASLELEYGDDQRVTKKRVFYIWPWQLILVAGTAILLVVTVVTLAVRRHNRVIAERVRRELQKEKGGN